MPIEVLSVSDLSAQEQHIFATALGDAAALLSHADQYETMLDGILETMARIVPYETASIIIRDGDRLKVARARGFDKYGLEHWVREVTFSLELMKFRRLEGEPTPLVIPDTRLEPDWIRIPETSWILSHLSVPIQIGGETFGILSLDSTHPGFFTAEHGARLMPFAGLVSAALQNARLLRRTEQRAREFQELYETTRDLAAASEPAQLLEMVVERAMQLLAAPIGFVFNHNPGTGNLELVVCRGLAMDLGYVVRVGEGVVGRVAQLRMPEIVNDYPHWVHRSDIGVRNAIQAAVAVPISYHGTLFGVLGVAQRELGKTFDSGQATFLTMFAGQAGAALETARLLSETRQRAEQLSLLYDIGLTLNRTLDARIQLEFMFNAARRALRANRMEFFSYDPTCERLVFEVGIGLPAPVEAVLKHRLLDVREPDTLVGWVAQQRVPARVPDVQADGRWAPIDTQVKSALAVPVEQEHNLFGVLVAISEQANAFSPQDERLMILCGNQVAAAMELTRLFQEQARRHKEMEILREASLKFGETHDRAALAHFILEYALRLVAGDDAILYWYEDDRLTPADILWADPRRAQPAWEPRENGVTYTVARTGKPIVVDEVNTHPLFEDWRWGGSLISIPLRGGDRVRAVLNVAYEEPHPFSTDELRALGLLADQAAVALENARQYVESERQLRDARLLHRAGEALNRTLAMDETATQLVAFFLQAVDVDGCCISLVDVERGQVRVIVDYDPVAELRLEPGTTERLTELAHMEQVVQERRTRSFRRDALELEPVIAQYMDRYRWLAVLVVPLFEGERVIGLVELSDRKAPRDFSPDMVRLVESLAHQAGSALRNARLYEEMRRRAEELTLLNRIARDVSGAQTLDELIEIIEMQALPMLHCDSYYVAFYDAETEQVDFRRFLDQGKALPPFCWHLGPSLTRQVILQARALRIPERNEFFSPDNPPQYYGSGATNRSWLGAPMRAGKRVLGVISLQARRPNAFDEAAEELLQTIADQVAVAVDRIRRTETK